MLSGRRLLCRSLHFLLEFDVPRHLEAIWFKAASTYHPNLTRESFAVKVEVGQGSGTPRRDSLEHSSAYLDLLRNQNSMCCTYCRRRLYLHMDTMTSLPAGCSRSLPPL